MFLRAGVYTDEIRSRGGGNNAYEYTSLSA